MTTNQLRGAGVALATPFSEDGSIDWKAYAALIDHCITGGLDYLVALGTTGESATLSYQEKNEVLDFCIKHIDKRIPLVAGFGGNNTAQILSDLQSRDFNGIDAILSVSPYYNKPTQEGIYRHYCAVSEAAPRPIVLYNVPGRTGSNMAAATTLRIAHDCENVIAIKEASGDLEQCMQIVAGKPDNFLVISGEDLLTLPMISFGMDGVISVVANAFPAEYSGLVWSALKGNYAHAATLHFRLMRLIQLLFTEGNPGGVKCALDALGICEEYMRAPLAEVSDGTASAIQQEVTAIVEASN